jgi:glycosyltransferase involved in cell wall biosynthesis
MQTLGRIIWLAPDRFDVKPDKSTWLEMGACLRELGWTIQILTGSSRAEMPADDYSGLVHWIRAVDRPFIFRISLLRSMLRWLSRHAKQDDVVVMNEDALWLVPHLRRLGVRFIHLDFRTLPVDSHRWKKRLDQLLFWRLALRRFGRRVDGYSFITERLRKEVEEEFNLGATNYAIWASGVNLDRFTAGRSERQSDGRFRLLYHGSISSTRGLGLVIEALSLGDLPSGFEFVIVGDGPERIDLERQAAALGVQGSVRFRGFVPYERVVEEISRADVCICPLPSRPEWNVSSPLKIFEYMACAKPMILTRIPAHEDVLRDARFVVWTDGFQPCDVHRAILEAFEQRERLAGEATAAPEIVRSRHEWRVQANVLSSYLCQNMGLKSPRRRDDSPTMQASARA